MTCLYQFDAVRSCCIIMSAGTGKTAIMSLFLAFALVIPLKTASGAPEEGPEKIKPIKPTFGLNVSAEYDSYRKAFFKRVSGYAGLKGKLSRDISTEIQYSYMEGNINEGLSEIAQSNVSSSGLSEANITPYEVSKNDFLFLSMNFNFLKKFSLVLSESLLFRKETDRNYMKMATSGTLKYAFTDNYVLALAAKYINKYANVSKDDAKELEYGMTFWCAPRWDWNLMVDAYKNKKELPNNKKAFVYPEQNENYLIDYYQLYLLKYFGDKVIMNLSFQQLYLNIDVPYKPSGSPDFIDHYFDFNWSSVSGYLLFLINKRNSFTLWGMDTFEKYETLTSPTGDKRNISTLYASGAWDLNITKYLKYEVGAMMIKRKDNDSKPRNNYTDFTYSTGVSFSF